MFQDTIRKSVLFLLLVLSCDGWAATRPFTQSMQFERAGNGGNCAGCEWIRAYGVISKETPNAFREYLAREGEAPFRIQFDSSGGDLIAAIELGRFIRSRDHFITEIRRTRKSADDDWHESIPGMCYDACVLAFLGGSQRRVDPKSRMGFGRADKKARIDLQRESKINSLVSVPNRKLSAYLVELGLANQFLLQRLSTIRTLTIDFSNKDIVDWGIDNSLQANAFTSWEISGADNRIVLSAGSMDRRRSVRFYCKSDAETEPPRMFANFTEKFRSGYAADQLINIQDTLEAMWITIAGRAMLVESSEFRISSSEDNLIIEVALPHELARQLTVAGATIVVKPDGLPDAYRDVLSFPKADNPLVIDSELMRHIGMDCAR